MRLAAASLFSSLALAMVATRPGTDARFAESLGRIQRSLKSGRAKLVPVKMNVDQSARSVALVEESSQGVNLEVSQTVPGMLSISGYLKCTAQLDDARLSLDGVSILGGGVNVSIRPFESSEFILDGVYKRDDGTDGSLAVRWQAEGLPLRDMTARQKGLDLVARWKPTGYLIEGKVDPRVYGKRELAVIGAALSTLTFDLFRL